MSLPEFHLSKPGVAFPETRVDNAEVVNRVRALYKGPAEEWATLQSAIEHVFGLCKTRYRYLASPEEACVADYAVKAAQHCLEVNNTTLDEVDLVI